MYETPEELARLQQLLDASHAAAGAHLLDIISDERRVDAAGLSQRMQGMCLLVVATVTADGRPLVGPVDGYLVHGDLMFSSGRNSVRMRHLASRPAVSVTYLPGEEFAVTVHGRAELFDINGPEGATLRQAMIDHYLPTQGPDFAMWLEEENALGARISADKMFTFQMQS
ncbi:MAG TPA: pyridoxamine 5'-phosphate oxidase family protein [Acidimicrobiales bacterium]|nr:pyridoxamine 5'-phosphate oxidase family protein [Acidimicrobiales bacterium]